MFSAMVCAIRSIPRWRSGCDVSNTVLEVSNLSVAINGGDRTHAVQGINLTVGADEIVCVVGESGSGKSVTAQAVMGLLPKGAMRVESGAIRLQGDQLLTKSDTELRAIRGTRMAMVFQEPMTALNPLMTVGAQVSEILKIHTKLSKPERKARVLEIFAATALFDSERIYGAFPHQLSGGQRQRAIVAMAMILDPQIIIADEPTTALDVTTQAQILKLMRELQKVRRTALLFVTHDFGVVAEIADRVAVMQHGSLLETGPVADILNDPKHTYTQDLIRAIPKLVPPAARNTSGAKLILSARQIEKSYGGPAQKVHAVKSVSFELRQGETLGIVGESGSGKSTLARCVVRLIEPDTGDVILNGQNLCHLSRRELRPHRKTIQMIFQDPYSSLNPRVKVGQLVAQGPIVQGKTRAEARSIARDLLNLVGLDENALERYPHEFSGGQRQRIGIARALALSPSVLVADEPVSALDVSVQSQVLDLLAHVRRQFQLAMLFITHDLRVAAQVCDRVAVMQFGEIVEEGSTANVFAVPTHPYTRALLNSVPGRSWETDRLVPRTRRPALGDQ
jgi:peptide/nickel transport system ATP-binding protein